MQVRKQQLEVDMEKNTASKSGKEYVKDVKEYINIVTLFI